MRIIVNFFPEQHPPLLRLAIHHAPHRRMHTKVLQQYREHIMKAMNLAGIVTPIDYPIDLSVLFVDPSSPDLDNLLTALYQAIDGKTLRGPSPLADDGLISKVTLSKFFPGRKASVA